MKRADDPINIAKTIGYPRLWRIRVIRIASWNFRINSCRMGSWGRSSSGGTDRSLEVRRNVPGGAGERYAYQFRHVVTYRRRSGERGPPAARVAGPAPCGRLVGASRPCRRMDIRRISALLL